MKKVLVLALLGMMMQGLAYGQAGNWLWARQGTGHYDQGAGGTAVDTFGNVYATGTYFDSTMSFGSITLPNAGGFHFFLVKYSSSGTVIWAKCAQGGDCLGNSVTTDNSGNVYVTGTFSYSNTLIFDTDTLTNPIGNGGGMFLVKYSPTGQVLWSKIAGDDGACGNSVATDASGNVFVTGYFHNSTIIFGTDTLHKLGGMCNSFIVKYSSSGTVIWAQSIQGYQYITGMSVATDISDNLFVMGNFNYNVIFGTDTLINTFSVSPYNIFIAKYSPVGMVLWAKNIGSTYIVNGAIATDISGNLFVTGSFQNPTLTFGSDTLINADSSGNSSDMFILKYNTNGTILLAKSAGGINRDYGCSISIVRTSSNVSEIYVSGTFSSNAIIFDSDTLLSPNNNPNGPMFVVKYDENLNVICASALANISTNSIAANNFGDAFVVGKFSENSLIVGSDTLLYTSVHAHGTTFFIAKYNCDGTTVGNPEIPNPQSEILLYPNPATTAFTITSSSTKIKEIKIINVLGEVLYKCAPDNIQSTINSNQLNKGIYFVQITDENKRVMNKKVVVQ